MATQHDGRHVRGTPFPSCPSEVAPLTVPEFTCELDLDEQVSIDAVCERFLHDANRALVWFIRFRALTAWRERTEMSEWLRADPAHAQTACELAASFDLNGDWQFDPDRFRSAVAAVPQR